MGATCSGTAPEDLGSLRRPQALETAKRHAKRRRPRCSRNWALGVTAGQEGAQLVECSPAARPDQAPRRAVLASYTRVRILSVEDAVRSPGRVGERRRRPDARGVGLRDALTRRSGRPRVRLATTGRRRAFGELAGRVDQVAREYVEGGGTSIRRDGFAGTPLSAYGVNDLLGSGHGRHAGCGTGGADDGQHHGRRAGCAAGDADQSNRPGADPQPGSAAGLGRAHAEKDTSMKAA